MIDIVRLLHQWVPSSGESEEDETFDRLPVVGDQKTMERGVEAQFSVSNAYTRRRRLEGVFFQLADWHHENKFLSVSVMYYMLCYISCNILTVYLQGLDCRNHHQIGSPGLTPLV